MGVMMRNATHTGRSTPSPRRIGGRVRETQVLVLEAIPNVPLVNIDGADATRGAAVVYYLVARVQRSCDGQR